jgi:serine O-acetyltransferase
MPLQRILLEDLAQNWKYRGRAQRPAGWLDIAKAALDIRFLPVLLLRVGLATNHAALPLKVAGRVLLLVDRLVFGVECAAQADIGPGLYFPHTGGIVIGANRLGARCVVYHQVTLGAQTIDMAFTPDRRPTVGDDVIIASGAKVLGGVTVGDRAVIAANAVVVRDVPPGAVVGGVPATIISEAT